MKRCGFYIRVSTDRQAKIEEGSLKNQDHLLTQHVEIKNKLGSEPWTIVDRYVDEGRSAKDVNRPAFQRMMDDVKTGRINAILCLALSRISRSTRDLLDLVEFFTQHNVDFISLKEDVDTTTPMGRLLLTFMGGLNQFEREQTGERTRAAFLARAERGLWNGGHLFGYDVDPNRKGYLIPNENEKAIVRFIFDTYLETGSVYRVKEILNEHGYKTKSYTSRRGKIHPACRFSHGRVYQLLTNPSYIGKKEINVSNGKNESKLVHAVWPALIDENKFYEVQRLLKENCKSHNNGCVSTKHFYLLNGGLLHCHKCGSMMEGRNGHGHKGRTAYYYYFCKNKDCRFKLPQFEVENAIAALIGKMAQDNRILPKVVAKLNQRLKKHLPDLKRNKQSKETELQSVTEEAERLLAKGDWSTEGKVFIDEQLKQLGSKRKCLESDLEGIRTEMRMMDNREVDETSVRTMLQQSESAFFDEMKPYKRKELLQATIKRFEISDSECQAAVKLQPAILNSDWSTEKVSTSQSNRGAIQDERALRR